MDTIAVVGAGQHAIALLVALAESRYQVVSVSTSPERVRVAVRKRLPATARAHFLGDARFDCELSVLSDCSVVVEAEGSVDSDPRARFLATLEQHLSEGAVLVATTHEPALHGARLRRPDQFVGIATESGRIVPIASDDTAPGALFAVERLADELAARSTLVGMLAPVIPGVTLAAS